MTSARHWLLLATLLVTDVLPSSCFVEPEVVYDLHLGSTIGAANSCRDDDSCMESFTESECLSLGICHFRCPNESRTDFPEVFGLANTSTCQDDLICGLPSAADQTNGRYYVDGSTDTPCSITTPITPQVLAGLFTIAFWVQGSCYPNCTLISVGDNELALEDTSLKLNGESQSTWPNVSSIDWTHVVITQRSAGDPVHLYIDSSRQDSSSFISVPSSDVTALVIGPTESLNSTSDFYRLVDVRMYEDALTDREIEALFTGSMPNVTDVTKCRCPVTHPAVESEGVNCTDGNSSIPRLELEYHGADVMLDDDVTTSWASTAGNDVVMNIDLGNLFQVTELNVIFNESGATPNSTQWTSNSGSLSDRYICEETGCVFNSSLYRSPMSYIRIEFQNLSPFGFYIDSIQIAGRCNCGGVASECIKETGSPDYRCQCENNTFGDHCGACQTPFYKYTAADLQCRGVCRCNPLHALNCNQIGGGCTCKENVRGPYCDSCILFHYNLTESNPKGCDECSCNRTGSQDCQASTGSCYCKGNVEGDNCDRCVEGHYWGVVTYSVGCTPCDCDLNNTVSGNDTCDINTGQCDCKPNVQGRRCDECVAGFYNLTETNDDGCSPCDCYLNRTVDGDFTCDNETGQCVCLDNFKGPQCEQCEDGFYNMTGSVDDCIPCDCYTNGTMNGSISCNDEGQCDCIDNVTGLSCDRCADTYYELEEGNIESCSPCECDVTGTTDSGLCDAAGNCSCKPNVEGYKCDACVPGFFNLTEASVGCLPCECDIEGSTGVTCHSETGQCPCKTFVTGRQCDMCEKGFYNISSDDVNGCSPCNCDVTGTVDGSNTCNETGQCDCKANVQGSTCDACEDGYYDLVSGCLVCDCDNTGSIDGVCDKETGQCSCQSNVTGVTCDRCSDWTFNLSSTGCEVCDCDELGSESCDDITGTCDCRSNVNGSRCDECDEWHYGIDSGTGCSPCNCLEAGTLTSCNATNGQCDCKANVEGRQCDVCQDGYYGMDESNGTGCTPCVCHSTGSTHNMCDKDTGTCPCRNNVEGVMCDQCRNMSFDLASTGCKECDCDQFGTESCNNVTGTCNCLPSFTGSRCTINTTTVRLGGDCQSASCETTNSACVTKTDSSKICECKANYIQINETFCQRDNETEHLQVLLVTGTRHNTLVAEMKSLPNIGKEEELTFQLKTDSEDARSLLSVDEDSGRVVCAKDVALDELILAKDYSFFITANTTDGLEHTIAIMDVLVVRINSVISVEEGYDGEVMLVELSSGNFDVTLKSSFPEIVMDNGSLLLNNPRDYQTDEILTQLEFDVVSMDNSIQTSVGITLRITDTNDKRPTFSSDRTDVFMTAGSSSGSLVAQVSAADPDTVGEVTYSLRGRFATDFRIDKSGTITALDSLKRSKFGKTFTLEVSANDGVNESEENIFVHVTLYTAQESIDKDLNMTFVVNVTEHDPIGTFVLNVSAQVANYSDFQFLYPSINLPFYLNASTSIVAISGDIDREAEVQYWLDNLEIAGFEDTSDRCNPVQIGELIVNIIDKNDNAPTFSEALYEGEIVEEADTPVVVNIQLTDRDIGPNADLKLSSNDSTFVVSYTDGQVTITPKEPLDREAVSSYVLEVTAVDSPINGDPPLTGSAIVVIRVTDINDNDPVFLTQPSVLYVTENESPGTLITFNVTDEDEGVNADITFTLLSGGLGYFRMHDTGELRTTQPVDRENLDQFDLIIRAADKGPFDTRRFKDLSVTVYVRDINDNIPEFNKGLTFFERVENGNCSSLNITINANDPDAGVNGTLTYSLNHPKFSINETTGIMTCISELDRENEAEYTLKVSVKDNGIKPLSSETTVKILVKDVNDNAPVFSNIIRNQVLDVQTEADQFVMFVQVTDADSGVNSQVNLSIYGPNSDWFEFNSETTGVMQLSKQGLTSGLYTVTITATDSGDPPLSTSTSVDLIVREGLSDESNVEVTKISVPEGSYSGETIGEVMADDGESVTYRLSDNPSDVFTVNEVSGAITCSGELDRETEGEYLLLVNASYTVSGKMRQVLVIISIEDVNDNAPQFVRGVVQVTDIPEDAATNTFIQTLEVTDLDAGLNGVQGLHYSIINDQIPFAVDPVTGVLTTRGPLDREIEEYYVILVQVKDGGTPQHTATANISIYLNDINDNPPAFTQDNYVVNVPESTTVGTRLEETISASDPDYNYNGTVTFSMDSDPVGCPFSLTTEKDSTSGMGVVRLDSQLDFETRQRYQCNITAVDGCGGCQLETKATLSVVVVDNNDERPTFQGAPYTANVTRDAAVGNLITDLITATDDDTDYGNNVVRYKLLNYKEFFTINTQTGVLRVKSDLTHLQEDTVYLQVEAADNPATDQPLSATTTIWISILDTNPRPWFPNQPYAAEVTEEEVTNGPWSMRAMDTIDGKSVVCNCTYTIVPSNFSDAFTIDEDGIVSLVSSLDREETGSKVLVEIEATDSEIPRKSAIAFLDVTVLDINDNMPYFTQRVVQFSVNETLGVGAVIGRLDAVDEDEADNAVNVYSAIAVGSRLDFRENGAITVRESLITEQQEVEVITFAVSVFDGEDKNSRPVDVTEVSITVHPYDPNSAPTFEREIYEAEVPFLSPRGTAITLDNLSATDRDGDTVKYSIAAGNTRNIIDMDRDTGMMTLNHDLESSIGKVINLTVEATDDNVRPKTGSCLVTITVMNSEASACVAERQLQIDSEQREIYLGLFIGMAVLLALASVATIYTCYKWRAAKSKSDFYQAQYKESGDSKTSKIGDGGPALYKGNGYTNLDASRRAVSNEYDKSAGMRDFSRGSVHNPGYISAEKRSKNKRICAPPPEPIPDYDEDQHHPPARHLSRSVPVASNYKPKGYQPTNRYR